MKVLILNGSPKANGNAPGQAMKDLEGLQTIRTLARNMTFLMKSIALVNGA